MEILVGLDVSLASTSVCVLNANGETVNEAKVPSDPESLAEHLGELPGSVTAVGLEAGPLSQWLHRGLQDTANPDPDRSLAQRRQDFKFRTARLSVVTPVLPSNEHKKAELDTLRRRLVLLGRVKGLPMERTWQSHVSWRHHQFHAEIPVRVPTAPFRASFTRNQVLHIKPRTNCPDRQGVVV